MSGAAANLLGGAFSQIAYVTNDFDRALADFADVGVTRFLELRDIGFAVGPAAEARCHVGLARSGGMEIEIIQPLGGADAVYRGILQGPDFQLHFHHVAQRLPDVASLERMKAQAQARGIDLPVDAVAPEGLTYFYADLRRTLGHMVEYVCPTPAFVEAMAAAVPIN